MTKKNQRPNLKLLVVLIFLLHRSDFTSAEVYFHPSLIEKHGAEASDVDLSHFQNNQSLLPGKYRVDVFVNQKYKFSDEVDFTQGDDKSKLIPHFSQEQIKLLDFTSKVHVPTEKTDFMVQDLVPDGVVNFDDKNLSVNLSIAQIYMVQYPQGYVAPSSFDHGINSLFLNYQLFGSSTAYKKNYAPNESSNYLNLQSGLNLGAWRFRNYSLYQYSSKDGSSWDNVQTYAQRDIQSLHSQLVLGEYYLSSELFDVFSFKGAYLFSDEVMRPDSMMGFAPTVRGIAKSNAMVEIKQSGHVIYQKEVPPGPFEINDLYQTFSADQIEVTITESDGEKRTFYQSVTSLPILEREKKYRYNLVAGRFNDTVPANVKKPYFGLGTLVYGFPYGVTGYIGAIGSNDYQAYVTGLGKSMGKFGVASIDVTYANSQLNNTVKQNFSGQQYRFQYLKQFKTDTNFSLNYSAYSKTPYFNFSDATEFSGTLSDIYQNQKKSRLQLSITQNFSRFGSLYLTHDQTQYREGGTKTLNTGLGYLYSFGNQASMTVSYSLQEECCEKKRTNQFSLGFSFPLFPKKTERATVNYQYTVDNDNQGTHSASISGSLLKHNQFSYSVQANHADKNTSGSVSLGYLARQMQLNAGYSQDSYQDRFNYGVSGGIVAHSGGVTLSQPMTDNIVLVDTNGISDIRLTNKRTILTDRNGYAVLPYASPYRQNEVEIDVEDFDPDTEAMISSVRLTPTRGAVVKATYDVQRGRKILLTLKHNGKALPFGTMVHAYHANGGKTSHGIVDTTGQVFISGLTGQETIKADYKNEPLCSTTLNLDKKQSNNSQSDVLIEKLVLDCE